jgi:hypothetical protein
MMSLSVSKQDCRNVIINSEYAADFSNNKLSVFEMKIFFKTVQKARNRLHRKSTLHHAAAQATSTTPITEPTKKHHHNLVWLMPWQVITGVVMADPGYPQKRDFGFLDARQSPSSSVRAVRDCARVGLSYPPSGGIIFAFRRSRFVADPCLEQRIPGHRFAIRVFRVY